MQRTNVLLIINPVAGRKKGKSVMFKIIDFLCRNNCKPTVFVTTRKNEAKDIVIAHAAGHEKIVCCGGDGTLHDVISGLAHLGASVPIGFIPIGTTNDLANSLDLPTKLKDALLAAVGGRTSLHDVGKLNDGTYFSYVSSFGAFVKSSYNTPQGLKNIFGRAAYILNGIFSVAKIRSYKLTVVADGREIEGRFIFGSVSNSTSLGGLVKFKKADVCHDDGRFEVLLIKKPASFKEFRVILKGFLRRQFDNPYTYFFKAGSVSFVFEKSAEWSVDGEYGGELSNVRIDVLPGAAQIIKRAARPVLPDGNAE